MCLIAKAALSESREDLAQELSFTGAYVQESPGPCVVRSMSEYTIVSNRGWQWHIEHCRTGCSTSCQTKAISISDHRLVYEAHEANLLISFFTESSILT